MTESRVAGPLEELQRFGLDEPVDLDVAFCDLVKARDVTQGGPYELRFRGTRQPDGARVRGFVPLLQVEGGLITSGAMAQPVDTDAPPLDKSPVAVPLQKYSLTLTKRRKGNGDWYFEVAVRDGAQATDLTAYLRCLRDAADQALPVLRSRGLAVGSAEIISIAGQLYAARLTRQEGGAR